MTYNELARKLALVRINNSSMGRTICDGLNRRDDMILAGHIHAAVEDVNRIARKDINGRFKCQSR